MKKATKLLYRFISILCLSYYASQYYIGGGLNIGKDSAILFTFIITCTLFGLVMGIINYYQSETLKEQNRVLTEKIAELSDKLDYYHYSEIKSIHSNMEAILGKGEKDGVL